ncbi:hypothetical protein PIB30_056306 [Stylosanthes scabra]|uniref:Ribonuclease H1 N-terminal domain-containing protein n=1 Tax=Stylosanthes scabra TaxID=79078 RepID=A0ABU6QK23_9FABA|nr:hypothetical protein [Stylosanthes scabra]
MASSGRKFTHYAVRIGRVPGIYTDWDEAEEQVLGFPRAKFKGFHSLEEEVTYMQEAKSRKLKGTQTSKVEWLAPEMQKMGVGSSQATYTHDEGSADVLSQSSGSVGGTGDSGGGICDLRGDGDVPSSDGRSFYSQFGGMMFSFRAELRCDEKGVMLQVDGCACSDEGRAREDAAYTLLEKLLIVTGHRIMDFNYRKMCAFQRRLQEEEQGEQGHLRERVAELERDCAALLEELDTYKKHLGF